MNILNQIGYVKVVTIQVNNMELCPKFSYLNMLCLIEVMLISQIIPFIFIVPKMKGAHYGLQDNVFQYQ